MAGGRRQISHGGEVSGFTAENDVYPDEKTSVMRLPADGIGPLGAPSSFTQAAQSLRGGMVFRRFTVAARGRTLSVTAFYMPDGKIEQFLVMPAD